jgi:hypothetical protein
VFPVTQSSSKRAPRHERILTLTAALTKNIDSLTLDEIDGEYYWRICRDNMLGPLIDLGAPFAPPGADGHTSFEEVTKYLFDNKELANAYVTRVRPQFDEVPYHVWLRLWDPNPIPLRPSDIWAKDANTVLEVRVYSRAWSGVDLEAELAWRRNENPSWFGLDAPDTVSIRMDVALVRDPQKGGRFYTFSPYPIPVIEITLPFPLPSEGVAGRAYDAIVRDQQQWHLELPGGGTKQEKEVALRTWAIGLLMAGGETFTEAQREVDSLTGRSGVSQTRFQQNRKQLVERVPEAKPYLYARGDRSTPL